VWVAVALTLVTGVQYLLDGRRAARAQASTTAPGSGLMRIEIVAVGTELLLGQIADTNAAWLGEQLALGGIDSHFHQAVGDNQDRIVLALRTALARSDGVVVCGGLGPTHDDITRDAIAQVMNVKPSSATPSHRGEDRRDVLVAGTGHAREQRPPGRRAREGHPDRPAAGDRPGPHLPGGAQGRSTPCPASPTR
jgi:molybdenum cofactor synthesis domain-containing protein